MATSSDPLLPCRLGEGSQYLCCPPACSCAWAGVKGIPFFQTKAVPAESCCIYSSGEG